VGYVRAPLRRRLRHPAPTSRGSPSVGRRHLSSPPRRPRRVRRRRPGGVRVFDPFPVRVLGHHAARDSPMADARAPRNRGRRRLRTPGDGGDHRAMVLVARTPHDAAERCARARGSGGGAGRRLLRASLGAVGAVHRDLRQDVAGFPARHESRAIHARASRRATSRIR
jgi:hypothetical protein